MSKVLITGMSAAQASRAANARTRSFTGVLEATLRECGHQVIWEVPSLDWNKQFLDQFDSVVVGLAPITSLSANYCYGGLHVITEMLGDPRLTIVVDSPLPGQIEASLKSVLAAPQTLTKDFYFNRRGFQQVNNDAARTRLLGTIERLLTNEWPTTIYPSLPWHDLTEIKKKFLPNAGEKLVGINLDSLIIGPKVGLAERRLKWSADQPGSTWTEKVAANLIYPVSPMKWNKGWNDTLVEEQIGRSTGVLISPHKKDGTWWTYRYTQALSTGTPVVTPWTEAVRIDESWGILASTIETLSAQERDSIATRQRESYLAAVLSPADARAKLQKTLRITKRKVTK